MTPLPKYRMSPKCRRAWFLGGLGLFLGIVGLYVIVPIMEPGSLPRDFAAFDMAVAAGLWWLIYLGVYGCVTLVLAARFKRQWPNESVQHSPQPQPEDSPWPALDPHPYVIPLPPKTPQQ
ncbi:hypothetical protein ACVBEQ_05555 [Nakamurella sp. GG22]